MGIDFSHCEAHWAYSGFMRFRTRIATEAGIVLSCMSGFSSGPIGKQYETLIILGESEESGSALGFDKYVGRQSVIPWESIKDDIAPLLNHSDCDGKLTSKECAKVAPRLRELVAKWPEDDRDKINALELVNGMDSAVKANDCLRFC